MTTLRSIAILGSGYTGRWIYRLAGQRSLRIRASSRQPDRHLNDVDPQVRFHFDLADPTTWTAVPTDADLIWAFPATPIEQVRAFARQCCTHPRKLVVLGSTSAYDRGDTLTEDPPPWIDETHPINPDLPRVQGEEYLRVHHGAMILRVAGIYGPNRNPVDWIRQGRVGPTNKFVNLIHVEDLAQLCLLALQAGQDGETYNVSDGEPRRWADICAEVTSRWGIVSPRRTDRSDSGKRIRNQKVVTQFMYSLRHPDLYHALMAIEAETGPLR